MPHLEGIDHIHINVSNRKKAEQWYSNVLGLKRKECLEFWANDGGPLTVSDQSDTIHLALFESTKIQEATVALKTSASGLKDWIEHLNTHEIVVKPINHDISWSIYFKDPDGNPYEITTYEYDQFKTKVPNKGT